MFHHFSVGCCHGSVVTEVLSRMCCHRSVTHRTETCPQHRSQGKFCTALQLFTSFSRQVLYSVTAIYIVLKAGSVQRYSCLHRSQGEYCTALQLFTSFTRRVLYSVTAIYTVLKAGSVQRYSYLHRSQGRFCTALQLFTSFSRQVLYLSLIHI